VSSLVNKIGGSKRDRISEVSGQPLLVESMVSNWIGRGGQSSIIRRIRGVKSEHSTIWSLSLSAITSMCIAEWSHLHSAKQRGLWSSESLS